MGPKTPKPHGNFRKKSEKSEKIDKLSLRIKLIDSVPKCHSQTKYSLNINSTCLLSKAVYLSRGTPHASEYFLLGCAHTHGPLPCCCIDVTNSHLLELVFNSIFALRWYCG